jgi:hypothetical protein
MSDRWFKSFQALTRLIVEQAEAGERKRLAAWYEYLESRWYLARGNVTEARRLLDTSLGMFPAVDRRWLFWLLTRRSLALQLPSALRGRLGIATQLGGEVTK